MKLFREVQDRIRLHTLGGVEITLSDEEVAQLDREIDELLASIAEEPDAETADPKMMQLAEMQEILAFICFSRIKLPYSVKQRQLVRNYDRWDDAGTRQQCFGWIKAGTFP